MGELVEDEYWSFQFWQCEALGVCVESWLRQAHLIDNSEYNWICKSET